VDVNQPTNQMPHTIPYQNPDKDQGDLGNERDQGHPQVVQAENYTHNYEVGYGKYAGAPLKDWWMFYVCVYRGVGTLYPVAENISTSAAGQAIPNQSTDELVL
jgi:hypothetical protein